MSARRSMTTSEYMDSGSRDVEMDGRRAEQFRRAMGRVPTGVSVVTVATSGGLVGMTVATLTYASSAPPMIVLLFQRTSARARAVLDAGNFGVSVLARNQAAECVRFASSSSANFDGLEFDTLPSGIPKIRGAVLWLEAHAASLFEAGDHIGMLARIDSFEAPAGHDQPLAFYRSKLASLNPASGRHIPTEPLQWW
jgi:3-hydroxy-9,10-secoandrosta-1,3,5(10)-triene-9,17-dione monooxygenase reductase component